jgi:AraC-like DNA-binding protein
MRGVDIVGVPHPRYWLGSYQEYDAPPEIAAVAEAVWVQDIGCERTPGDPAVHRVLPDPAMSLAFTCVRDRDGRPSAPRLSIIGPVMTPRLLPLRLGAETVAVKLKLEWVPSLFGISPFACANGVEPLTNILPRWGDGLFGPLTETRTREAAMAMLRDAVTRLACRLPRQRPKGAASIALDAIRETGGRLPVEDVASGMGVSIRQLRRVVGRDAGVSMKSYSRMVRLVGAILAADRLGRHARPSWAQIAQEAGYYDQSHLVLECRALIGLTPDALHRERRAQERRIGTETPSRRTTR